MPSNGAATNAFNTTEILVHVLSYLDVKTLLLAQRVSRRFHEVINDSTNLQIKLFLRPGTYKQAIQLCSEDDPWVQIDRRENRARRLLNTCLVGFVDDDCDIQLQRQVVYSTDAVHDSQSPFQRMLLSQPAIKQLRFNAALCNEAGDYVDVVPELVGDIDVAQLRAMMETAGTETLNERGDMVLWSCSFLCIGGGIQRLSRAPSELANEEDLKEGGTSPSHT